MSDTKEQVSNYSFPAYGTKPTTMKFSFRSPTEAAVKAALEAGNPAPIKADPVEIQIMAMSAEDIVQLARDFLNSPESPEAVAALVLRHVAAAGAFPKPAPCPRSAWSTSWSAIPTATCWSS